MAALVIKKLPDPIHKALKAKAKRNHRSMTQEVVAALESLYLNVPSAPQPFMVSEQAPFYEDSVPEKKFKPIKPIKLKSPVSSRWLTYAKHGNMEEHPEPMKLRFKVTDESFNAAKRQGLK